MKLDLGDIVLDTSMVVEKMKDRDLETLMRYQIQIESFTQLIQRDLMKIKREVSERKHKLAIMHSIGKTDDVDLINKIKRGAI